MPEKRHALVTNDDGIDSGFLRLLVEALLEHFEVSVAAPATEQSWIGRAMSRHNEISVNDAGGRIAGATACWSIDGTPSDCVNIALGHLLPKKPDIVCSGINIGYNTTDTLILSSGTVAGAIEGALWDIPAIAFSQCIPQANFAQVSQSKGDIEGPLLSHLKHSARHAAKMALELTHKPVRHGLVVNVNFPPETEADSPIEDTVPASIRLGSLYQETAPGKFHFQYSEGVFKSERSDSDRAALERGAISRSILDFSKIGQPPSQI